MCSEIFSKYLLKNILQAFAQKYSYARLLVPFLFEAVRMVERGDAKPEVVLKFGIFLWMMNLEKFQKVWKSLKKCGKVRMVELMSGEMPNQRSF